ncbi:hypothetical protein EJ074_00320 [Mesorhizobium sp. M3A.F.Ca.ET.080.04.2.1]|uniref:hypothetical protein n=1 Tax=Mesorhizobium sp. M3A.F.Ca.ET.080.04.2.1 TaxID=2493676 RepID=UPI000F7516C8|nr:hypothetical protein [Mesorhizobium sp. M3A.F.Ca.ET.080.04.2.1]AZO07742.1 hypothetical protein EJ074_00320 [Mesorhizobium sp. M3A.F.Ca.ET.080.04.2.1]RWF17753.1 MAG: hypothetical protein EOS64_22505 [Mesorhizobium sp.]
MTSRVSAKTELALRDAMDRLLSGEAVMTKRPLTVVNLAIEAGVSRATANRAFNLLAEFRQRVEALERGKGRRLEGADPERGEESKNARTLAQHVQARALHQRYRDRMAAGADVLFIDEKRRSLDPKSR